MELFQTEDSDSLASLEDRITRAVQLVRSRREQNADLQKKRDVVAGERDALKAERDAAVANAAQAKLSGAEAEKYKAEIEQLKQERKQVRTRIEKLLGQMDLLSNQ